MQTSMLFFAGNAKLKPFVPTERSSKLTKPNLSDNQPALSESLMTSVVKNSKEFDFLKDPDDMKAWEANQEMLDRQWYDAEEEGRVVGADDYSVNLDE
jgi:hypothetical protein